ncbi:MAG TPA: nitroreductase family protein [Bacillota bacterium]|nr:nitroreductase family protein [Bacillota bacterium]
MDVIDAILTRRSIRKFTGQPVTDEQLNTILRAGFHAPSAHNRQPWEFVVIKNKDTFKRIAKMHPYAKMLLEAEVCIIVCGDKDRQSKTGFLIEDCSAAIQNMLLATHGIGLGAVWCGLYPEIRLTRGIKSICMLPVKIVPIGMIVIGHKGEEKKSLDRFDEAKIHLETW